MVLLGVGGGSEKSHLKFIKNQNLPFPLLYDSDGSLSDAYGMRKEVGALGVKVSMIKRATVVIDEQGVVSHVMEKVKIATHAEDLLALI